MAFRCDNAVIFRYSCVDMVSQCDGKRCLDMVIWGYSNGYGYSRYGLLYIW